MERIRLARRSDIPGMSSLLSVLFDQEEEFAANEAAQVEGLTAIVDAPNVGRLLVCEAGREIVAMVSLLYTISTALGGRVAILEDMIVRADLRGRGLGRKLVDRAIEQCRSDGCRRITLLTDHDNTNAHAFYRRMGFSRSSMVVFRMAIAAEPAI